jgi:glycosyltransferase involved in cell wall biosynthesis
MIVIATHNGAIKDGQPFLPDLLSDIRGFNIPNNKVCVVDNLSTDQSHLEYLNELKKENYNILYNPISSFELGAFKYGVDNLKDDVWFFMQDSIRIKLNIFEYVIPRLTEKDVYTFLTFQTGMFDDHNDRAFLSIHFGTTYYSRGIYASSIFALDEVIQSVKNDWVIPRSKTEAAACERAVAVVFDRHNIRIHGLGEYEPDRSSDPNGYTFFSKIYGKRGR